MNTSKIIKNIVSEFKRLYTSPLGIDSEYGYGYLDSLLIIAKTSHNELLYQQIKSTEQDFEDGKDSDRLCSDLDSITSKAKPKQNCNLTF